MKSFRETFTLEQRVRECSRLGEKHGLCSIGVVAEPVRGGGGAGAAFPAYVKILVQRTSTWGTVISGIRQRLNLQSGDAIFLYVGKGVLVPCSTAVATVYDQYADKEDGFLYVQFARENTFG
jgi:hypothetical protein